MGKELRLAFVHIHSFETGHFRAAVLVTDKQTYPVEFRCTSPVKPSKLQGLLYGGVMREHIFVNLLALPLLRAIREVPTLTFVRDPILLGARDSWDKPMLCLRKQDDAGSVADSDGPPLVLNAKDSRFEPLVVIPSPAHLKDREVLRETYGVGDSHNFLEPFERAHAALLQVEKDGQAN